LKNSTSNYSRHLQRLLNVILICWTKYFKFI
jgi:hypothetical protein